MNPGWRRDDGGALRAWLARCGDERDAWTPDETSGAEPDDDAALGRAVDVAPLADRLVVFFADRLVHEVLPVTRKTIGGGRDDDDDDLTHRYALTLWLCADEDAPMMSPAASEAAAAAAALGPYGLCGDGRPGAETRRAHFPLSETV
mmetsp:Transcript_18552/g.74067  ORF Transcript_18552/g.74067 Transcript_18552/m.74067 type:complete len:147 (+) Transcript_18552:608-1048(+)